jgi:hypothetical protein
MSKTLCCACHALEASPGGAGDLDLRKVRYFAAVAEHLNFGRAAAALHIAQPVLSRQIRALENELQVQLFERDNRSTRLTPAGEALLEDARTLLPAADAARRRVRDVAAGQRTWPCCYVLRQPEAIRNPWQPSGASTCSSLLEGPIYPSVRRVAQADARCRGAQPPSASLPCR